MQTAIDEKRYSESHLIEITATLELPYTNDWQDWEAVAGDVLIDGVHYQYVERILKAGKMVYRCLPNSQKQQVLSARDQFVQLSYDISSTEKQQPKSQQKIAVHAAIGDFEELVLSYNIKQPYSLCGISYTTYNDDVIVRYDDALILPPEGKCC